MIAIGLVAHKVRQVWQEDQEGLSRPGKRKVLSGVLEAGQSLGKRRLASTESIIKKNLFDPERGTGTGNGAQDFSQGNRELGDLHLLGTVIAGGQRYAIVEFPPEKDPRSRRAKRLARGRRHRRGELRRLVLGDTLGGYELVEIHPQRVVFKKGTFTVDLVLDFSRKAKIKEVKEKVEVPKKAQKVQKARTRRRVIKRSPETATAP